MNISIICSSIDRVLELSIQVAFPCSYFCVSLLYFAVLFLFFYVCLFFAGDISRQKAVRERLKCKSFDWFMKEVAFDQDKYYPAVEPKASASGNRLESRVQLFVYINLNVCPGELRNRGAGMCVDTQFKQSNQRFGLRKCISDDPTGGGEQVPSVS